MHEQFTLPSPLQVLNSTLATRKGIELLVKREDLIHPHISGNKWRKLKYNLLEARKQGKDKLLTFGGAFSNNLYATAAAGKLLGFQTLGIVRGEAPPEDNPTLGFARNCGMQLHFVSRVDYARKAALLPALGIDPSLYYILPEGGSNLLALPGCAEVIEEINDQASTAIDYYALACGTGGTAAGMIAGLRGKGHLLGISVLKGNFHQAIIQDYLSTYHQQFPERLQEIPNNWQIHTDYHFKGYARYTTELIDFINRFKHDHQIALDPIYTGKLFYAIFDLMEQDYFPKGSTIALLHSGGLQGIAGFNQRFGNIIE